jgi:hypothetical protein
VTGNCNYTDKPRNASLILNKRGVRRCGVFGDVFYRRNVKRKIPPAHEQAGVRALTFGHTFAVLCAP